MSGGSGNGIDADDAVRRCFHEAGHATTARRLKFLVPRVIADEHDHRCTTRWRRPETTDEEIGTLLTLGVVDASGREAESRLTGHADEGAAGLDMANLRRRCTAAVALRRGVPVAELDDEMLGRARCLEQWCIKLAAKMVVEVWPQITAVAYALAGGPMTGDQVDEVMSGASR